MLLPKWKEKKIVAIDLWQWNCRNGREKKRIMAMELLKIGGERERERENCPDKKYIYIYLEESITSPLPPDS